VRSINPVRTGVAFGFLFGLVHLAWAALVATGAAQVVIDFILRLHFIEPFIHLQPFDLVTAAMLVAFTTVSGFVLGAVLAVTWNQLQPQDAKPMARSSTRPAT
jgi:hypothetical protein